MIGRSLAHYRIVRELGSGGMGAVYLAEDTKLGREVALKVLPDEFASDAVRVDRFEREARTVASFNHPNIVTLHSVEEAEGIRFLTMEHVEGRTLDELTPDGGLNLERLFEIAIPLADALATAHAAGITHRDLKPGNVMVSQAGLVKILDFGLAKPSAGVVAPDDATLAASEALTGEGTIVGTVPYMSPEQIEGRALDARSDIFSLGVLLYEMITGDHPFGGDSSASLLASILKDDPRPVIELKEVPRQLSRIIQHCLEKDPQRRFQSALDVRNELEALRAEERSQKVADTPAPRAPGVGEGSGRRTSRWIAATAVAILVLGALWLASRSRQESKGGSAPERTGPEMVVVLPFENLGAAEDEYFAAGIAEEITSRLASVSGLGVISRNSARRYVGIEKSIAEIGSELGVGYVLEGTVRWARASEGSRVRITPQLIRVEDDLQLWSNTYDRVLEDIFEVQSDIAGQVIDQLGIAVTRGSEAAVEDPPTDNLDAYQAYLRGLDSTGRRTYSREDRLLEVEMFERAVELDPDFTQAWARLSDAHCNLVNLGYDKSEARIGAARRAIDRALAQRPEMPDVQISLAFFHYWCRRDYGEALKAVAIAEEKIPGDYRVLYVNAFIARRQGRWQDAIRYASGAQLLDPVVSNLPREIGTMYHLVRDYDNSLAWLDRSIALAPDQQASYVIKAIVYWQLGDLRGARAALEAVPGEDTAFKTWFTFTQAYLERDWDAAEIELLKLPEGLVVPAPDLRPSREHALGEIQFRKGNESRARELWQLARTQYEEALAASPDDARLHGGLGRVLADLGRFDEALASGRRAVELYPLEKDALHGVRQHYDLAVIAAKAGDEETVLAQLDKLLSEETWVSSASLRLDPSFDVMRDRPRFAALLERHDPRN